MKILIAKDDQFTARILKTVLEKAGHEVVMTTQGMEAWQRFDADPVPVVISDWMMPKLDGLGLCQKVRGRKQEGYTYFILLTARTGREEHLEAMRMGVDDFLGKPLDCEELFCRLGVAERILESRQ